MSQKIHKIKRVINLIRLVKNWWEFIFPISRLKGETIIKLRNCLSFYVRKDDPFDVATVLEICAHDAYNLKKLQGEDVHTIVDVGAHIGTFTILASRIFPNSTIYSIEPLPENYYMLKRNLILNKVSNVKLICAAIWKTKGLVNLNIHPQKHTSSSIIGKKNGMQVKSIKLSQFDPIDILKFDAEGIANEVLPHPCSVLLIDTKDEDQKFIKSLKKDKGYFDYPHNISMIFGPFKNI